jgi:3-deoxy-manno-octulosonate cytidylyltransferase (CMP-KDO synthetase)
VRIVAIIPARYDSSRFPGKPLADILGKSMIQRVYEQVSKLSILNDVIIATDDDRIMNHARTFGASVYMTSRTHNSGTDRVAEMAGKLAGIEIVLNIQGDEPFILPEQIKELCDLFESPEVEIASLISPVSDLKELNDPNVVKASFDEYHNAITFSRDIKNIATPESNEDYFKHLGIYGFNRETLLHLATLPTSKMEQQERLEQLRWLENGFKIKLGITQYSSISIDTPEDLEKAIKNFPNT